MNPASRHLRAFDNRNRALVAPQSGLLALSYFNVLRLRAGESLTLTVPGCELLCVALAGAADVSVAGQAFEDVGRRAGIWDGPADSVYCGTHSPVTVRARHDARPSHATRALGSALLRHARRFRPRPRRHVGGGDPLRRPLGTTHPRRPVGGA